MSPADHIEAEWRRHHGAFARLLLQSLPMRESIAEPESRPAAALDERLVQAVWADQMVRAGDLATASGKAVEVLEPGRWNTGKGPDFVEARLRVAGQLVEGDVEIHLDSADWRRHGHDRDFEYNRTILHVVLRASDDRPYDERQNGDRLERLVLMPFLEPDLDTIRATINPADYPYAAPEEAGLCHQQFLRLPDDQLEEFLLTAGRARIEAKVARFAAQAATVSPRQLLHQAVLTAQGHKASKTLYFLLSKRAPIEELAEFAKEVPLEERTDFHLSIFLYVTRLMPEQLDLVDPDEETADFVARLQKHWRTVRPYFADRLMPPTKRWFAGLRPAGFPPRRLAACAVLVGRILDRERGLLAELELLVRGASIDGLKPRELSKFWRQLAAPLMVDGDASYFGSHFTIGGKKQKPQALLGEPAALSLLFNTILPLLVLEGRSRGDRALESNAWKLLLQFPALDDSSISRFMRRRLFAGGEEPSLFAREVYQQALFKVFTDCCSSNERNCNDCTFLSLAERHEGGNP
jgi:hypothetical protein